MLDFRKAADVLQVIGQTAISSSSVWRRVEHWGDQFQAIERFQEAKAIGLDGDESVLQAGYSRTRMGAAMDGTMIHILDEGWKELKVGCVFEIEMRAGLEPQTGEEAELGHAVNNSYAAHLGGPERLGNKLWAQASQRGWMQAEDTLVLGDGALWIWNLAEEHFYDSHQLVDWYHGNQHLAAAARWLHGEGTPKAQRWHKQWETTLYQGNADQIADLLTKEAGAHTKMAEELRQEAGYFRNNQRRMHYLEMRTEGYPIGSGMVESAAKQYKARFAGPGMRWSRAGAERLLPIRTAILSDHFDVLWNLSYNSPPM